MTGLLRYNNERRGGHRPERQLMPTRVFIYQPEPSFQPSPEQIIRQSSEVQLIGVAADFDCASFVIRSYVDHIDVALLSCAVVTEAEIGIIRGIQPIRALVLSPTSDDDTIVAALRAGARGYMTDVPSGRDLIHAIKFIDSGGAVFCQIVAQRLGTYLMPYEDNPGIVTFPNLTCREREILDLVARGLGNRQISRQLVITDKTVRNHITQIFLKIQVSNRPAAIVKARNAGVGISWRRCDAPWDQPALLDQSRRAEAQARRGPAQNWPR
jgi:DNA-binding NarL/FixJ family response regulator